MIFITDVEEAKRIGRELRARGVKWASGREITDDWANLVGWVFKVEYGKLWCMTPCELNNATLAKIPKPEPCVVIRHEVQEEGVLRLLDELGVRWLRMSASEYKPGASHPSVFPYALTFNITGVLSWTKQIPKNPQSTKDFMEGVKNALL